MAAPLAQLETFAVHSASNRGPSRQNEDAVAHQPHQLQARLRDGGQIRAWVEQLADIRILKPCNLALGAEAQDPFH